ncbi:MAG TPA: tetratricopeptide repeat protein [Candidatus Saccharimonadales bacterium]|nr:tetratricopeptide repeat protein [Candidatus Saccharimonadales bacterium]
MNRRLILLLAVAAGVALFPSRSPAPLIYTPGEGWYYVPFGTSAAWQRNRAKDQLDVAEQAFKSGDYSLALRAADRVVKVWPLSDYAPRAQYLVARCLEAKGKDEMAFNAYQVIIDKYPKSAEYEEVLWRQYAIAARFLGGEWPKLWGYIPYPPSMDLPAGMFGEIVTNGPYSDVAPHAQLRIGAAREMQKDYPAAVKAYEVAADRYQNQPVIVADALYRQGIAYAKESPSAQYDQSTAAQAIATFTDFIALFPDDRRVGQAQRIITALKARQVQGNFEIAQFYEKSKKWDGAVIYYNEVLQLDPYSRYAALARQRIETLKPRLQSAVN